MQFATLLTLAVALIGAEAKIGFTDGPGSSVTAGNAVDLKWDGATAGAPVTITLKKGDPDNLQTVALLTGNANSDSYVWTPSKDLPSGDDYALEISQGQGIDSTNFSGQFSIKGGKAAASSSSGYMVTITSGTSSYVTMETGGASSGTGTAYSTTTKTSNMTVTSATPTSSGIQVPSEAPSATGSSSSSQALAAAVTGSVGGLAVALFGAVALL